MDKSTLNAISGLVAFESIPKAKKGEPFEDYVTRVYPEFESFIDNSENPFIQEIKSDSEKALHNAISKLEARRMLVKRYCMVNDSFDVQPPEEATIAEILEHNGVEGTEKELKSIMGQKAFEDYIDRLKTPKKDGHTQTEIKEMEQEHYSKYEPAYPSEKEYKHGSGGTTRKFHWEKRLQEKFLEDHQAFLDAYGLEDSFPKADDDNDSESEQEQESETSNAE